MSSVSKASRSVRTGSADCSGCVFHIRINLVEFGGKERLTNSDVGSPYSDGAYSSFIGGGNAGDRSVKLPLSERRIL